MRLPIKQHQGTKWQHRTSCKRIVELHGGTIWAESDIGQGSMFHVWLPRDVHAF